VEDLLGVPFLGVVPTIVAEKKTSRQSGSDDSSERDHFVIRHPRSSVAEACRTVRSSLMFMGHESPAQYLLVTSSGPREGKTTVAVNLAVTMAQSGARTLLVDTDLRRPRLHKTFGVANDAGVSTLILGTARVDDTVHDTGVDGLQLLPCGPVPPNPTELLHSGRFRELLDTMRDRYDRVVFDSPPVIAVADASVLSTAVDGVVLVGDAQHTAWQLAGQAVQRLERVGARIFGFVLNKVVLDDPKYGGYYQYYDYRYGADSSADRRAGRAA
jgi:capsular exopolysaccharide synthesis family protein